MKITGDYGYVVKDEEGYHVYGDKTDETQGTEVVYRIDDNKLKSVPMDFPVYADVHDFGDDESSDMHREAYQYMDKEHLLLEVKRLIMMDETIPLCDENIYFIAKQVLEIVDWQDLCDFVETDFAEEDLPVYKEELPVQPAKAEDNSVNVNQSTLLDAIMKYKAEHQKDLSYIASNRDWDRYSPFTDSSLPEDQRNPFFEFYYDVFKDQVFVTYGEGKGHGYCQWLFEDVNQFKKNEEKINAALGAIVNILKTQLEGED